MGNKTQPIGSVAIELLRNFISNAEVVKSLFFDNLACEQLDIKLLVLAEEWAERYMGDDGTFTMYLDVVNQYGYTSSIHKDIGFPLTDSISDVFKKVVSLKTGDGKNV
ncbi:MAG: hypothetical protein LBC20_05620 [Planctomycetaceae bacterium]|nr:hypothetical protein [Planctomycetaceae bacterium]